MSKRTYERWSRVFALALKGVGLAGILFVPIFWAFTDRAVLGFLPFFGTLATAGLGVDVLREVASSRIAFPPIEPEKKEAKE